jgi:predicted HicB family RNase H-like nuclease
MKQINVKVPDDAHATAKAAAAHAQIPLRLWVERAVVRQAQNESASLLYQAKTSGPPKESDK